MFGTDSGALLLKRGLAALAVCALAILCLLVLRPFLAPILWAAILAYVTWPLYERLRLPLEKHSSAAALLMTLLVVALAIVPLFWLLILMQHELVDAYRNCMPTFAGSRPFDIYSYPVALAGMALTDTTGSRGPRSGNYYWLQRWRGELTAHGGATRNG
jgi:hypothetical protein